MQVLCLSGLIGLRQRVALPQRITPAVLSVFLSELKADVVVADGDATVLSLKGASRVLWLEELDEGEALDGAEEGRRPLHVLRDVDVLDGSILLEHGAERLNGDVAREVASDECLDADGEGRHSTDSGYTLDSLPGCSLFVKGDEDRRTRAGRQRRGSALVLLLLLYTLLSSPL